MVPEALGFSPSLPDLSFHRGWSRVPLDLLPVSVPTQRTAPEARPHSSHARTPMAPRSHIAPPESDRSTPPSHRESSRLDAGRAVPAARAVTPPPSYRGGRQPEAGSYVREVGGVLAGCALAHAHSSPPDVRLCTHCLSQMRDTSRRLQITLAPRIPAASTRWLARCTTAPRGSATSRAMAPARRAWKRSRQASLRAVQRRKLRWRQFLGMQATCRAIISEPSGHRIGGAPPLRQLGTRPPGSQCPASRCTTSSSTLRRGQCGHGSGRRGRGSPRVCHAWPIWHCALDAVKAARCTKRRVESGAGGQAQGGDMGATVEGNAVCERGSRVDRQTRQKRRMYSILAAAVNTQQ